MPDKDKDNGSRKETSGQKRKARDNSRCTPDHIEVNVVENGTKIVASSSDSGTPSTALVTAMQEGFTLLSGNLANPISEAFKSFKVDFEISFHEEKVGRGKREQTNKYRC